ncbi:helicase-related protein [Williamsia sterculiae]|uniref:Helicase conserved C-terminal domain-containing protein n=1 Tax=Williamsia sterculiae TaxID=1344003 RepID=A0A1N7HB42_9NOCA|nr:helicase-related protein [Williamsia sterculiae]SIS21993.1 Helicase conserved C-terminal domain-containing protein [Williamsia sterculiae]
MWTLSPDIDLSNDNIPTADAERQLLTAKEILHRLNSQAGLVLADEVGMGKTFVALAVAASVVRSTDHERPVVVMVPPSVVDKWPREWNVFARNCLDDSSDIRVSGAIRRGTEFLKLLDDPPGRRKHIIFLTHGALNRTVTDPFVRLSLLHRALGKRAELQRHKKRIIEEASFLVGDPRFADSELVEKLLSAQESRWMQIWNNHESSKKIDDDPVPAALLKAIDRRLISGLQEALLELPINRSKYFNERLKAAKAALTAAMKDVWSASLTRLDESLPLLILDEAHHVKNNNKTASLFSNETVDAEVNHVGRGALGGMFGRMLFLTATPFQLGHHELLNVLGRFDGIRWETQEQRAVFAETQESLRTALDAAQLRVQNFQKRWSALDPIADAALATDGNVADIEPLTLSPTAQAAVIAANDAQAAAMSAQQSLRPWVIRHVKPNTIERRKYRPGASVLGGGLPDRGLQIDGTYALPFLLSGRADAVARLTRNSNESTRSLFAYGITSSFEAYRRTRTSGSAAVDDSDEDTTVSTTHPQLAWYLGQIDECLPDQPQLMAKHPKIAATVAAALELWSRGSKVLIFCFYRETGRALRLHISRAIEGRTRDLARESLNLPNATDDEIDSELHRLSDRLLRSDSASFSTVRSHIRSWTTALEAEEQDQLVDIAIRFLRTDSFLVRFVKPRQNTTVDDLLQAMEHANPEGVTLRERVQAFAQFLSKREVEDRTRILGVLQSMKTGDITVDDIDPAEHSPQNQTIAPNVRLANGEVKPETRQRLMAAFNSPFFPDVLVASSVMAEGVDLHTACRHVIHHDLDWNPATLEQRTGRLDRIGSAALLEKQPVVVYEPYLGGTHDEKMFRVVKERERWFGVVMGDTRTSGEPTDHLPLPATLAARLTMDLAVHDVTESAERGEGH